MLKAPRGILLRYYIILDKKSSELESYMYAERDSVSSEGIFNGTFSEKMANECSQKCMLTSQTVSKDL